MPEALIMPYKSLQPKIDSSVFVAPTATIIGDVTIEEGSSVWFNTVLRGDIERIHVGKYTNIQDNSTVHVMGDQPTIIGNYVTIGHNAVIHCKQIGDNCLIGMGSVLLGYCEIGENTIIGAGTVVTQHKKIPPNSLVLGSPGRIVRPLLDDEIEALHQSAIRYSLVAQGYVKK